MFRAAHILAMSWVPAFAGMTRCVVPFVLIESCPGHAQQPVTPPSAITVAGDAIPAPLTTATPDAARGRAIVLDRAVGNCLICHQVPVPSEPFQGDIGPDLKDVGSRLNAGQIRLRLVDQSRLNPATMMPPLYRVHDLTRVAQRFKDAPVLTAAAIEDVVAYLVSLKD